MADPLAFQGNPKVIAALQQSLVYEAHLNLQYRNDQRLLKFMGVKPLAGHIKSFGDDAHDWQKAVTKQLLFLGGNVAYEIPPITSPDTVTDVFTDALVLEMATVDPFETAIQTAMAAKDDASRNLWEHLRKWHNKHILWLNRQLVLIKGTGENDYIAQFIR
jgi:bacterioferritin